MLQAMWVVVCDCETLTITHPHSTHRLSVTVCILHVICQEIEEEANLNECYL